MILYISILVIILLIIYIFTKNQKPKIQQSAKYDIPLKRQPMSASKIANFIPYKIVENDNALRTIVDDYDRREQEAIKDFETRLGKALPNDVIWSILQDLIIECWETTKNKKVLVNTEYQMGLLLQKEKKYKDAISHYSMGLYYVMNFYPHKFNPRGHLIDCIKNDYEVIEMAQEKFINKIKLCIKYSNLSIDDLFESIQRITTVTVLKNINPNDLLGEIAVATRDLYLPENEDIDGNIIKKKFNYFPADFKAKRTEYRTKIKELKKEKIPLEDTLNDYYKFCVMQQILYGYYPVKNGVNGFYFNIIEQMIGSLSEKVKDVSFIKNGFIAKSEFISENDYKTFIKCFGETSKSTDFKIMYDDEFNRLIEKYKNKKFDSEAEEFMHSLSYEDNIKLANKTRNNDF